MLHMILSLIKRVLAFPILHLPSLCTTSHPITTLTKVMTTPGIVPKPQFYRRTLPETCIIFHSKEGKMIFKEAFDSGHMECYFALGTQFRTQDEPAYCGLSTLVMVLNTLEVDPKRVWKGVWRWYHEDMLDCCVPLESAVKHGITIDQFACLASCNALTVSLTRGHPDILTEDNFRKVVKEYTSKENEVIVVSYDRRTLGQTGTGHFSPIGGYHPDRDLVLIMDTARFKYPPHWVALSLLCKAMHVIDPDTGLPRGYLILKKSDMTPMLLFKVSDYLSVDITNPQSQPTISDSVQRFLDKWNDWLNRPSEFSEASKEMLQTAIAEFVSALTLLDSTYDLLTTQLTVKCPDNLSQEHSCAIYELVSSMECTDIYKNVKEYLTSHPEGIALSKKVVGPEAFDHQCCRNWRDHQLNLDTCSVPDFNEAHFLTALLLTWPKMHCYHTNGHLLRKSVTSQLSQTSVILQNEMALLHQQLESVFVYISECKKGKCYCKSKSNISVGK